MNGVVRVIKSKSIRYRTQTTRSWDFTYSLSQGNSNVDKANHGKDAIVGVIDSGVWPRSQSFNDEGMEPVPNSWKGICQPGAAFDSSHCNRKLIGARYYLKGFEAQYGKLNETLDFRSARDRDGHGTHTASTVAGREVPSTAFLGGLANGTAAGGATLARLAIYKVCWAFPEQSASFDNTCLFEDMLAAFDDAISDGVHVISISIVPYRVLPYDEDGIAIGAFHAAKNNILVVASGGNEGPGPSTVNNLAPWIFTTGASSIDRVFTSSVTLGDGTKIQGQTVTDESLSEMNPLVYAGDVEIPGTTNTTTSGSCLSGTLSPDLVKGKIVLCLFGPSRNVEKGVEVKRAGGVGFILENPINGIAISVDAHVLPGTAVFSNYTASLIYYIQSTKNPTANIPPPTTDLGIQPSPFMAGFSSVGPNPLDPYILKPDITAPGLNILAAWSEASSPTDLFDDDRRVKYNVLSGTSMSCPHVAAAAALVKTVHPDWSAAAVRSALMTTATRTNRIGQPITDGSGNAPATPFHFGSGHFQPGKALSPGLVYDANYTDYLLYLCRFNSSSLGVLEPSFTCPSDIPPLTNLNYPSISVSVQKNTRVKRTVTNVENSGGHVYKVKIDPPSGYRVEISPDTLNFSNVGESKSFTILITPSSNVQNGYAFGWYTWSDGNHDVTSPIVVSK
ncbi:hypothetical protein ACS0TY_031539 [Phlomoides rotata]